MSTDWVGLMAKWPEAGKVKTRLAAEIGTERALSTYCSLLDNVFRRCHPDARDTYRLGCFVTPGDKCPAFAKRFPGYAFYQAQTDGDLGQRMQVAMAYLLGWPQAQKAILIGADIPLLSRAQLRQAFHVLATRDVVWGPTDDGGYYLIGLSSVHTALFQDVDWGTERVLRQSTDIARQHSLSFELLEPLHDLDTAEDLTRFPFLKHQPK